MLNHKNLVRCPESASITALWRRYIHERADADRDELARIYLPWANQTAAQVARRLRIADWENAAGEALMNFARRVIPSYNGVGRFEGYAIECLKRSLITVSRREREPMLSLDALFGDEKWKELLCIAPCPSHCECRFQEIVRSVDHRTACLLYLRFQRGLSRSEAADALGLSDEQAHHVLAQSYAHLRRVPEVATMHADWTR